MDEKAVDPVAALRRGAKRVTVRARRDADPVPAIAELARAVPGRTLVVCEFDRVRPSLAALAAVGAKPWPEDAPVVVGNYERVGLHARRIDPSEFGLLVMAPRLGQNARSAAVLVERFEGRPIVQYAWDAFDIVPDATPANDPAPVLRRVS